MHAHVSLSVSSVPFLFIILGSVLTGLRFWVQAPMADFKFLRFEVYVIAPTNGKFKIRTANRAVDLTCSFIHWQELPTRWRCGEAQQACYSVRCIQLDSSWITANGHPRLHHYCRGALFAPPSGRQRHPTTTLAPPAHH